MSASGGKVEHCAAKCPLRTQSGHSPNDNDHRVASVYAPQILCVGFPYASGAKHEGGKADMTSCGAHVRFCSRYWGQSGPALLHCVCPLLALSGPQLLHRTCPLLGAKRAGPLWESAFAVAIGGKADMSFSAQMFANDPKQASLSLAGKRPCRM